MDPTQTPELLQKIFKQGTEQIISLFENYERKKMSECMDKNINNMNDFVRCTSLSSNVLEENRKRLEMQIMYTSLHASDCLNVNDEGVCKEGLKVNLTKIYNEYNDILK